MPKDYQNTPQPSRDRKEAPMGLLAHQSVVKTPRGADSQSAAPRLVSASGRTSTLSMLHRRVRAPQGVFKGVPPRSFGPQFPHASLRSRLGLLFFEK
jgi:hypothetical protein